MLLVWPHSSWGSPRTPPPAVLHGGGGSSGCSLPPAPPLPCLSSVPFFSCSLSASGDTWRGSWPPLLQLPTSRGFLLGVQVLCGEERGSSLLQAGHLLPPRPPPLAMKRAYRARGEMGWLGGEGGALCRLDFAASKSVPSTYLVPKGHSLLLRTHCESSTVLGAD